MWAFREDRREEINEPEWNGIFNFYMWKIDRRKKCSLSLKFVEGIIFR